MEKYAVYERLMKCKYGFDDGGLVLTGRGVPDRATRNLLSGRDTRTIDKFGFSLNRLGIEERRLWIPDLSFIIENTGLLSCRPRSLWF